MKPTIEALGNPEKFLKAQSAVSSY